jgi:hypothetical protein
MLATSAQLNHSFRAAPPTGTLLLAALPGDRRSARPKDQQHDRRDRPGDAGAEGRAPHFAEALTALGLMAPFFDRSAAEIDQLIEAAVTGYVDSMQRQAAQRERSSYGRFWVTRLDQAARFSARCVAMPSVNVTPSMTNGNWFAPFRRRHVFAAA